MGDDVGLEDGESEMVGGIVGIGEGMGKGSTEDVEASLDDDLVNFKARNTARPILPAKNTTALQTHIRLYRGNTSSASAINIGFLKKSLSASLSLSTG